MKQKQLTLRQELDALAAEGKEIKVSWEGGNDSGGFTVSIDDKDLEWRDEFADRILLQIEDVIDYGSWAGDFYADGHVIYDADQGAFVGEGKNSTTDYESVKCSIKIKVPKELNFDILGINTEGDPEDNGISVRVSLVVNNGPVFPEHGEFEDELQEKLEYEIQDIVSDISKSLEGNVCGVYNDLDIMHNEFKEEGDFLVYTIKELDYSYNVHTYHDHYIQLKNEE